MILNFLLIINWGDDVSLKMNTSRFQWNLFHNVMTSCVPIASCKWRHISLWCYSNFEPTAELWFCIYCSDI